MFDRRTKGKTRQAQEFVWPAPVAGLVRSGNIMGGDPRACEVLENFIPTAEGAKMRGGCAKRATIDAAVTSFIGYRSGLSEYLFAATEGSISDVTSPVDADTEILPTIDGLTGGDWSSVQFATAGGQFVTAVNSADYGLYYNGSSWNVLYSAHQHNLPYDNLTGYFEVGQTVSSGAKSTIILAVLPSSATAGVLVTGTITGTFVDNDAITTATGSALVNGSATTRSTSTFSGVSSDLLSFVWSHKKRLWFVETGTLSAWYLPVNSITGAAVEFPLDGVFRLGGSLMFGGAWSQDSGSGLDDLAVFVTSEGEVAVYQGSDPSSASDWSLVGVYVIGRPLGKNAWFRAGGDLVILTEDGIVPVSEALKKDRAALQAAAVTAPIEDLWQQAIANRSGAYDFSVALWSTQTTLWLSIPTVSGSVGVIVANTRTGAWATITGWAAKCFTVFQDKLYFGTADGYVVEGDVTGADMGAGYSCKYVPKFQEFGTTGDKVAMHSRYIVRASENLEPALVCFTNYEVGDFPPENDTVQANVALWGSAVWGSDVWGGASQIYSRSGFRSVSGIGYSLSVGMIIGSNGPVAPTGSLVSLSVRYEAGASI